MEAIANFFDLAINFVNLLYVVGIIAFLVIGGLIFGAAGLRNSRVVEGTATSNVRSAAQGYVELEGTARAVDGNVIISPLAQEPCVWWSYEIAKRSSGDKSKWTTVRSERSEAAFYLDDETGRCTILPLDAEVVTKLTKTSYGTSDWPSGRGGTASASGRYRYTEHLIPPESYVYAAGTFSSQNVAVGSLHTLSKSSGSNQPFLISSLSQKEFARHQREFAYFCFAAFGVGVVVYLLFLFPWGDPTPEWEMQWKTQEPSLEQANRLLLHVSPPFGLQLQAPSVPDYDAEGWAAINVGKLFMRVPPGWMLSRQETSEYQIPSAGLVSPDGDAFIELRFFGETAITEENRYGQNAFQKARSDYESAYERRGFMVGYAPHSVDGCFGHIEIMNAQGRERDDDGTPTPRMNTFHCTKRVGDSILAAEFSAYFAQTDQNKFSPLVLNTLRSIRFESIEVAQ